MTASLSVKQQAQFLRLQGKTYNEITKQLGVPKSTLSGWFRTLKIPQKIEQKLMSKRQQSWRKTIVRFNKKRGLKIKEQHKKAQEKYALEIGKITRKELKLIGVALYWAEGYKRGKDAIVFCNSDPYMVKLMMKFFRSICKVPEDKFKIQIQLHNNISKDEVEFYWKEISGIPETNFRAPLYQISKSSKGSRPSRRLPYGVCRILIHDVGLVDKILGWIQGLKCQI